MKNLLNALKRLLKQLLERPIDLKPDPEPPAPPSPPPTSGKWTLREVWFQPNPRKVMFVRQFAATTLISSYDGKSRKNSWLDMLIDGRWKTIYKGSDETLGPIGEWGGRYWCCAEKGKYILSVGKDGSIQKHAKIARNNEYNVFGTVWEGRPVFGGLGSDPARVYHAQTGGVMLTSPLNGLIAGMTVADNVLWLAISDNKKGLASSVGHAITSVIPASVAYTPNLGLIVGGMREGKVWRVKTNNLTTADVELLVDLKCAKVNRLYPHLGGVFVAAAKPDTFGYLWPDGRWEQIDRFEDEKPDQTGEQFDCDIAPGIDCILGGRRSPKGAHVYEWRRA